MEEKSVTLSEYLPKLTTDDQLQTIIKDIITVS